MLRSVDSEIELQNPSVKPEDEAFDVGRIVAAAPVKCVFGQIVVHGYFLAFDPVAKRSLLGRLP